jgi:hypothetical protein
MWLLLVNRDFEYACFLYPSVSMSHTNRFARNPVIVSGAPQQSRARGLLRGEANP